MKMIKYICIWTCLLAGGISMPSRAQVLPEHTQNKEIYIFLDELASMQVIELHSLVKPYARKDIQALLMEADSNRLELTSRQQKELDFYLRDYRQNEGLAFLWMDKEKRFDLFSYGDSLFQFTVNPILGSDFWVNGNDAFYHWWNGLEASGTIGNWAIWASLRDNHESTRLTARDFQNQRIGASNIKNYEGGKRDYWEFRGGITYAWEWGHAGIIMDQFSWGENNAGANILSGRTPSFPRIELQMEPVDWFRFTYVHGSLISEVVDSSLSSTSTSAYGTSYREVYAPKFMAANIFTFTPVRRLQLFIGNSIIYDYKQAHIAYLLPVAFYKAIDHTLNAGIDNMNSQLFMGISSRNIKGIHLFANIFLDEVAVSRIFSKDEHNFVSYKFGASTTLVPDMRIWAEYTWTNALTYRHYEKTTTFESNKYNLGHYLEDNSREIAAGVDYHLFRGARLNAYALHAIKGPDHTALGTMPRQEIPPLDPVVWESFKAGIRLNYQLIHDLYIRVGYEWRNCMGEDAYLQQWTPEVYHGKTHTLQLGINYGF